MVALNLKAEHKTVINIETRKAFTLAIPGIDTIKECDFFGMVSAYKETDKFERTAFMQSKVKR